jgi:hypothetical protein
VLRKVAGYVLQFLGLVGLPSDLRLWWNVVIPAMPSVVAGLIGLLQGVSLWQAGLIVVGVFVAAFLVSIPAERGYRRFRERAQQGQGFQPKAERAQEVAGDHNVITFNQMGGQTAKSIVNQGPQPRRISKAAGAHLIRDLEKHPSEHFDVTPVTDPEAMELAAVLQDLLEQAGWEKGASDHSIGIANQMPSGVLVETTVDNEAVATLIEWMKQAGLDPWVNRGSKEFEVLRRAPSAPVHIVVGVLPR